MELIYLWVEKYKNIHEQGFNFSPRFECKFHYEYEKDEEGGEKLKDDCKLEIKPKEHIENFFAKNINVTAIVGKNGCGKSSLLRSIIKAIHSNSFMRGRDSNFLFVFEDNEIYFKYIGTFLEIKSELKNLSKEGVTKANDFFSLYYDNSFSFIKESAFYQAKILENLIFAPNKIYNDKKHTITFDENEEKKIIIRYLMDKKHNKTYGKYFEPNKLSVNGKYEKFDLTTNKQICKNFKQIIESLQSNLNKFKMQILLYGCEVIKDEYHEDYDEFLLDINTFNKLENLILHREKILMKRLKKIRSYLYLLNQYSVEINDIFLKDEEEMFVYLGSKQFLSHFSFNIKEFKDEKYMELLSKLPPCFSINIQDNDLKYEDLSSGEKSILRIRFHIEDIILKNKNNIFFIFLDEPANDMHPDWQKKLLNYLIEMFKDRKQKFHFIITTHSPFLISDLPQENIIFLEDGKQVKGLNKQTFGANIHTLLSDSFFMKDGLMGEFAKGKINEIKRFYEVFTKYQNNKKIKKAYKWIYLKKRKKFEQIQLIIGEPFLKTVIKNYLDEIENILFDNKAKEMAIERIIREYGIEDIEKGLKNVKS